VTQYAANGSKIDSTIRNNPMNILRLLPVFISFLLLAAHFMRAGQTVVVVVLLLLLPLLLLKKFWVPWVMQLTLLLGALEWVRTIVFVAQTRMDEGMPWTRMAVILGVVALFTALSSLVFRSKALRKRYSDESITE
jgi:hypothetical protein